MCVYVLGSSDSAAHLFNNSVCPGDNTSACVRVCFFVNARASAIAQLLVLDCFVNFLFPAVD